MKSSVRAMVLSALMTALICILSQVSVPVGITAVTLQTFAIALAGYVLGARPALWAALAYLALGACGLPVYSCLSGGLGILIGPTGGFLFGFPVMAFLCGLGKNGMLWRRAAAGLAGLCVVYILGTVQMSLTAGMSLWQSFLTGVAPFVIKDVLSVLGACLLGRTILRRIPQRADQREGGRHG